MSALSVRPYSNPVSVSVPVSTEYEPDRVAPVWLIFVAVPVVALAMGSCPPAPPPDGSHLILILPAAIFVEEGFVVYSNLIYRYALLIGSVTVAVIVFPLPGLTLNT